MDSGIRIISSFCAFFLIYESSFFLLFHVSFVQDDVELFRDGVLLFPCDDGLFYDDVSWSQSLRLNGLVLSLLPHFTQVIVKHPLSLIDGEPGK